MGKLCFNCVGDGVYFGPDSETMCDYCNGTGECNDCGGYGEI